MPPRLPRLPKRKFDAHKGDFGRILIVAGSAGMCGAAVLASNSAYRAGAGLVTLGVPETLVPVVGSLQTCAVIRGLPDSGGGALGNGTAQAVRELSEEVDVIAIGPGLGRHAETGEEARLSIATVDRPLVIDADALNAFVDHPELLGRGAAPRIFTPHPGELARLTGGQVRQDREAWAREAAKRFLGIVVLKGHRTVVTDGAETFLNRTGNPGMATGGTGDVLTGVIAALIGQGLSPWDAARLGVHLHGLAGDLAARKFGQVSLMATDLLEFLPAAIRKESKR